MALRTTPGGLVHGFSGGFPSRAPSSGKTDDEKSNRSEVQRRELSRRSDPIFSPGGPCAAIANGIARRSGRLVHLTLEGGAVRGSFGAEEVARTSGARTKAP